MSRVLIIAIFALGLFAISCASTKPRQTVKFPVVDENGETIDWAKEIEAYNADPKNEIKIICKKVTPTGSHIPRLMCQTSLQQENRRRQDQRAVEEFVRGSS